MSSALHVYKQPSERKSVIGSISCQGCVYRGLSWTCRAESVNRSRSDMWWRGTKRGESM